MEEPASALFSVLNALPHALHLPLRVPGLYLCAGRWGGWDGLVPSGHYMRPWLALFPVVGVAAWTASAAFHTKKTTVTIPLDYIGALALLSYCVWLAVRRAWGPRAKAGSVAAVFLSGAAATSLQCVRIARGQVPFQDHLHVSIAVAAAQSAVWVAWGLLGVGGTGSGSPFGMRCVLLQAWFGLAALFEIFDFPPIWSHFDAHSLWHAATVPLGFAWYAFWRLDCNDADTCTGRGIVRATSTRRC
jgi:hypothetical protein